MKFSTIFQAGLLAACAVATPLHNTYEVHERRDAAPMGWKRHEKLKRDVVLPMRFGLKQRNLENGWEYLQDVSHPSSPNFGKHWTAKQVAETFSPSEESRDAVMTWLASKGISADRMKQSQGLGWIEFDASVAEAEDLLQADYHIYKHETGHPHVACEGYSLPAHIKEHIDFVTPTVHFDAKIKGRGVDEIYERGVVPGAAKKIGQPGDNSSPRLGEYISRNSIITQLENCDKQITPACLRALYEFLPNNHANKKNSYGIVEYTPQAYLPGDLDLFFANFSKKEIGQRPIFDSIDGGVLQTTNESFNYNGESDLDLEYGMTLVYPQQVTLYQVGDLVQGASFNNFLDAIDGSYCKFEGGDDPTQDGIYPDPLPGGYKGPQNCGGFAATKVISTSYGSNEVDNTQPYEERQCQEYMKLGLMGVSVLYSSGDNGVAGNFGQCLDAKGNLNNGTNGAFNPSFPGVCPYVTSVGATQVKPGTNVVVDLATGTEPEMACETVIYSGGGFSNRFPIPDYQKAAVNNYLTKYPPPYGADRFNNSGKARAFPDISANGANYVIAVDGKFGLVYGTSASSPTLGAILTLINQARFDIGKGPVGFINPTIYAHPKVLNDIVEGGNQGCGTPGFSSAPGWDPVTGLGTPNFPKLLALYLTLP